MIEKSAGVHWEIPGNTGMALIDTQTTLETAGA
jgi:hypothetical protein